NGQTHITKQPQSAKHTSNTSTQHRTLTSSTISASVTTEILGEIACRNLQNASLSTNDLNLSTSDAAFVSTVSSLSEAAFLHTTVIASKGMSASISSLSFANLSAFSCGTMDSFLRFCMPSFVGVST